MVSVRPERGVHQSEWAPWEAILGFPEGHNWVSRGASAACPPSCAAEAKLAGLHPGTPQTQMTVPLEKRDSRYRKVLVRRTGKGLALKQEQRFVLWGGDVPENGWIREEWGLRAWQEHYIWRECLHVSWSPQSAHGNSGGTQFRS